MADKSARRQAVAQRQRHPGGGGSTSREWGEFMEASKVSQVKDVWDVKGADLGHKASKQQLEDMTARFRSAASSGERHLSKVIPPSYSMTMIRMFTVICTLLDAVCKYFIQDPISIGLP